MSDGGDDSAPDLMLQAWNMVPVVVADLEGIVLMVSSAVVSMFGWERSEELVGQLVTDYVAPEDRGPSRRQHCPHLLRRNDWAG